MRIRSILLTLNILAGLLAGIFYLSSVMARSYFYSMDSNSFHINDLGDTNNTITASNNESWKSRGIGGGGALFSATMSPFDPQVIYITTDMSSVFRTKDFGRNWETIDFKELQGGHRSHVRFTADPNILYALHVTDELDVGIPVKSTDGGNTWAVLPSDPTAGEAYFLDVDPESTDRLIILNYDTLFFSNNGGTSFNSVYSSSDLHIAGTFWDGNNIFVGSQVGLLVSTDGGKSFTLSSAGGIPAEEFIISFAGAKEDGITRFFAVTLDQVWPSISASDMVWGFKGVYRLNWGEGAWNKVVTGITSNDNPYFVAMALNDIDVAYLAGGNPNTNVPIVYKTINGGDTWTNVFHTENNQNIATGWCGDGGDREWTYPEYVLSLAVSPTDSNRAIITDLGFAHVTRDGGTNWQQAYVDPTYENPPGIPTPKGQSYRGNGIENTSSWWLHWTKESTLIAGFSDIHGIRSEDGGQTWTSGSTLGLPLNSTYYITEHPITGNLYAAISSVHDIYESTYLQDENIDGGTGGIMLSTDKGKTWKNLKDFGHPVIWLAIDPNDTETMYASVIHSSEGGIYVTHNLSAGSSASWNKLSNPPRTEGHPFNIYVLHDGTLVVTYSGRRDDSGAFTESSGIFISTDQGVTWQDRSDKGMRRWTKDMIIDPHDNTQNTWYATVFSHWGSPPNEVGGIYRTTNRGQSWTRISDLYRVESCTIHPDNPDILYLSTEKQGLWYTNNLRDANPSFTQITDYPFRHPVRIFFNPYDHDEIWVTNFGGGLRVHNASASAQPQPDIKANGSDGSVTPSDNLSVTIALNPGSHSGENADWWLAVNTPLAPPNDWLYYDLNLGWTTGLSVTYQGPLFSLAPSEILNIPVSALPSGTYTFYLAVDMDMNGLLDSNELFFASVVVNIIP
jgi:photosystem II stability/assembly factor-like uncharacterized protein